MSSKQEVLVTLTSNDQVIIDADVIGGGEGELILFTKDEQVVVIFATGSWISAVRVAAVQVLS